MGDRGGKGGVMSSGISACSICLREIHKRGLEGRWVHCEDTSPICEGALPVFPPKLSYLEGEWCAGDADAVVQVASRG